MSPEQFIAFAAPFPESLCLIDSKGKILAINPFATQFLGITTQTPSEKYLCELSTDSKDKVEQTLRSWSRSREAIPGPLTIRLANKQDTPCNCFGNLIQPKSDDTPALILLRIEIREQFAKNFTALNEKITLLQNEIKKHKKTETALVRRNAEFEAMFNSIPDAVIFTDTERRIIMSNPAFHTMFGYDSQELIGKTTEILYAHKQNYLSQGKRRYRTGEKTESGAYDIKYARKDGSCFWSETLGTQVNNKNGETIGLIGLVRDVTDRRRISKDLEQHKNNLETMISERTVALEAANKELESFSYSVSHDLIAPLRAIDGFSLVLQEDYAEQIDATGKDYLERIRKGAQHMGTLITDLLSLSKVSQSELTRETIDLSLMAHATINKLQENEPQRKITINIAEGIQAWADKRLLEIALTNLLGNAWKYTSRETKAQIEFGATTNNGLTTYHVRDNGAGFNMKYAEKLFKAFQRLHQSDKYEGTGIGLATVARILHRHGGRIWAEAKVDRGATFYFTLGADQ